MPQTVSLPPSLIPMVELATHQLKAPKSPAQTALLNHQLAILFVSQLSEQSRRVEVGTVSSRGHQDSTRAASVTSSVSPLMSRPRKPPDWRRHRAA